MANTRTLQVKFGTEGLDQVLSAYKRVERGLDEAFESAKRGIKSATDAAAQASTGGLGKQFQKAEEDRAKAAQRANQIIANSFRELRVKQQSDVEQQKRQAIAAYEVIRKSGVASASDIARAQVALTQKLKGLDDQLRTTAKEARNMGDGFTVAKGAVSAFLGNAAFGAVNQLRQTITGTIQSFVGFGLEAESLKVRLETAFNGAGKSAAQAKIESDAAYKSLQQFANVTPFESGELVSSFVQLKNRGITPTIDELTKLGDLTSSQGKSFGQYTEAVLDAMTGQNERLREFGIDAKTVGDQVSFTFKGVTKTVGKETPDAIYKALLSFGALDGVVGGMAKQAETGQGKISTLTDAWKEFGRSVYSLIEPASDKGFIHY
jgi:flagellar capping protein FliD